MRGNCISDSSGTIQSLIIRLNGIDKQPDINNRIIFSAAEIAGTHNHDGKYLPVTGGTVTGTINVHRNTNGPYGNAITPMIHGGFASNDWGGIGHWQPSSDSGRLVLYTGDNANDPICCTQTTDFVMGARTIYLMDSSGNSSFYSVTANGNINTTGRYYQQGTVGSIVCFSTGCGNGNMGWAW